MMLVGVALLRASQRQMRGNAQLPDLEDAVATLDAMLKPPSDMRA
jgi:hypothetical protein